MIASLFSGIGGFDLGLERAGYGPTTTQVEIDPFCRSVLARHWPNADRFSDVREIERVREPILCAGFPCQDLSQAARGRNEGLAGTRSGLWYETLRIVRSSRPRAIFLENVAGAAERRWLPHVRRDLHAAGYASVPFRVRACDVGAPQRGARTFVVAAPYCDRKPVVTIHGKMERLREIAADVSARGWPERPSGGMALVNGVSERMALAAFGNAIVPRMAEAVGLTVKPI